LCGATAVEKPRPQPLRRLFGYIVDVSTALLKVTFLNVLTRAARQIPRTKLLDPQTAPRYSSFPFPKNAVENKNRYSVLISFNYIPDLRDSSVRRVTSRRAFLILPLWSIRMSYRVARERESWFRAWVLNQSQLIRSPIEPVLSCW
jgi:hypothetical protein